MTDCSNAEIRDLLPDYVHDRLSVTDLARVEQHLVSCAECTDELALLQTVFEMRPAVSPVNVAAIVASLPKPSQNRSNIAAEEPVVIDGVRSIASARSVARKASNFRNWRAAAAVAVFAVGSLSIVMARQGLMGVGGSSSDIDTATVSPLAIKNISMNDSAPLAQRGALVSVGDLSDYSDDEIEAIIARLDKSDGTISADPLPGVPILPPGS